MSLLIRPRITPYRLLVLSTTAGTLLALTSAFNAGDRTAFMPGETSHGHYQIELDCAACHTAFGGVEQDACLKCHAEELERARDTHPASKFTDPRNADLLSRIGATRCVTCHEEHVPERTTSMDVTVPRDYCAHCHQDIAKERPSHEGYDYFSCASAGCHNFHDNTSLYEELLLAHLDEPDLLAVPRVLVRGPRVTASPPSAVYPDNVDGAAERVEAWSLSAHARAGVNCAGCHSAGPSGEAPAWSDAVPIERCRECHEPELEGFLAGHHGMRLAAGLAPMTPGRARLPMRAEVRQRELDCHSCHRAHDYDIRRAAVEACLECHADEHSLAYDTSPHAAAWKRETTGESPEGTGVSCATCHMPRHAPDDGSATALRVRHNQNDNLRPREKMLRDVCMSCHGAEFALEALADADLGSSNYRGRPAPDHDTFELLRARAAALDDEKRKGGDVSSR